MPASQPPAARRANQPTVPARPVRAAAGALGLAALVAAAGWGSLPAHAATGASTADVQTTVDAQGVAHVVETLTFASDPGHLEQRITTREETLDRASYVHELSDIAATADGRTVQPTVDTGSDSTLVTLDGTLGRKVVLSYTVRGATRAVKASNGSPARTEFSWPVLQGLSVPVQKVTGGLSFPGTLNYVDCESGAPGNLTPCSTFSGGTHDSPEPSFTDGPRAAGDEVRLDVGMPTTVAATAVVQQRWSLDRAFLVSRATLLASLLPLLLGGALLWLLHRRHGRDDVTGTRVTPVAEFTPVGPGESHFTVLCDVRPGHVGTVADERVDPVDVTATLLDLAVRGWLRIDEQPRTSAHGSLDWRFERLEGGEGELRPFEQTLRDAVAPQGGPGVLVSELGPQIAAVVPQVQSELYDDVVHRGWFARRPDDTRNRWGLLAWVGLGLACVALVLLVVFTHLGLLGLALVILALAALAVAQEMPRRTAAGSSMLGGLSALASQLHAQSTTQLPAGREYQEISRILPYAVVLGGRDRWLEAMVAADRDDTPDGEDLAWYHAPGDWHMRDLPEALAAFVVTVQGRLFGR